MWDPDGRTMVPAPPTQLDTCWSRAGPDSLKEFQDVIWINSHSGQRQYPF
jgi:hypothetical protein